jgi:molecular chaperone GrpE
MDLEPHMHEDRDTPENAVESGERIEIEYLDDDRATSDAEEAPETQRDGPNGQSNIEAELERVSEELEQLREMYLRKLAEFDNFRKRTDREREEFRKTAAEGVIRDLLPVLDNFERAQVHGGDSDPEAFRQGIQMISRQLWELLEREGLAVLDPSGEVFDPELHDAVQRIEDSECQPGSVVSVMAKGFTLGGRLLRPAMVAVAVEAVKKAAAEPEQSTEGKGGARP